MSDLLDWPKYDALTGSAKPLPPAPIPVYTRPASPKQPGRAARRGWRERALDALFTAALVAVACALVLIVLVALALGLRDLFHLLIGGH